jgi:hypothetical protein
MADCFIAIQDRKHPRPTITVAMQQVAHFFEGQNTLSGIEESGGPNL